MQFINTAIIALLISSGILTSCRTAARADSTFMGETNSDSHLSSPDCEVWRFYLFNTLTSIIHRSKNHDNRILYQRMVKIEKNPGPIQGIPPVHELLPAHRARKIIDAVLTLEKGVCSRELLYETPCRAMIPSSGKRLGGIIQNYRYYLRYKNEYFSDVMGVPMNNLLAISYEEFLLDHLSQSPGSKAEFYQFGCHDHGYRTCNRESVEIEGYTEVFVDNNAGLCLLMKHHDYLKENNVFDLLSHSVGKIHTDQLVAEDLEAFIKKSYEIQESYGAKHTDE